MRNKATYISHILMILTHTVQFFTRLSSYCLGRLQVTEVTKCFDGNLVEHFLKISWTCAKYV